ncbi:BZ3500_MvSof-1268-A1-R1_Chr1-3g02419 [Microbotryum saponariae]|uniref:21S rRNA pseudouridine(2819) synthase n=1 Tax=Microbotryum saponariae TaxID=289078 RepID=A0A2X0KWI7_9BASI|nr:BZ3500_MvSof-1268-A1-R1_Chr1-3g02419 [Microbotryum saponariae]SCZ96206.1 BZ3501_MvSof-1269-A2-R1_Chr1-3g02022 [Microbotryum saponariae]
MPSLILHRWLSTIKPARSRPSKPTPRKNTSSALSPQRTRARPPPSRAPPPPHYTGSRSSSTPAATAAPPQRADRWKTVNISLPRPPLPKLLYQDNNLVVIDKPSGASLQGQYGTEARLNWEAILKGLKKRIDSGDLHPVHRLDKATTGTLILSKNAQAYKNLCSQLTRHEISRKYLAIVHGRLKPGYRDVIDAPLRVDQDRVRMDHEPVTDLASEELGKIMEAKTEWECLASSSSNLSLLLLSPQTGRKHQLRVHCSQVLRAPILGDHKYELDPDTMMSSALATDLPPSMMGANGSMFLHAWAVRLHVWDKSTGKRKTVGATAPLPYAFRRLLKKMGWEEPTTESVPWPEGMKELSPVERR